MPIAIIILVVIAAIGGIAFFFIGSNDKAAVTDRETNTETQAETDTAPAPDSSFTNTDSDISEADDTSVLADEDIVESPSVTISGSDYTDGTYSATASYFTPRNVEHDIEVQLTVNDDVVTGAEVLYDGSPSAATPSHSRFDGAYTSEVVGVALDDISLSRTGGASLTSEAFNEAVDTIKARAEA